MNLTAEQVHELLTTKGFKQITADYYQLTCGGVSCSITLPDLDFGETATGFELVDLIADEELAKGWSIKPHYVVVMAVNALEAMLKDRVNKQLARAARACGGL